MANDDMEKKAQADEAAATEEEAAKAKEIEKTKAKTSSVGSADYANCKANGMSNGECFTANMPESHLSLVQRKAEGLEASLKTMNDKDLLKPKKVPMRARKNDRLERL